MKTVLYLDELLLVNFALGAALLLGAGLLAGRSCTGARLLAGSGAAALASLGLLLPELPGPLAVLYKAATCCGAVAAAYGVPGRRGFARLCGWYALLNLLLGGAVLLPGAQSANLCLYLPLSPGRLLAACAAVYALLRGVAYCFGRAQCWCAAAPGCRCRPFATPALPCRTRFPAGPWRWPTTPPCAVPCPGRCKPFWTPTLRGALPCRRRGWGCGWCPAPPLRGPACCPPCRGCACRPASGRRRASSPRFTAPPPRRTTGPCCWAQS